MFIGVSGLIGVGKSTLTQQLADHCNDGEWAPGLGGDWKAHYEPIKKNPYLEDFYDDIPRWTFNMQMFLLAKRFQQHQEVVWDPCHQNGGGVVQDRTIYEDTIFARMHRNDGLMDDRDWETYISHFNIMRRFLVYPDVILYLRIPPELAMERILSRGRNAEKTIELSYLQALYEGYEQFVDEMQRYTLVHTIDWTEYLPVEEVANQLEHLLRRNQVFLRSLWRV